jgi:hypothetical protein
MPRYQVEVTVQFRRDGVAPGQTHTARGKITADGMDQAVSEGLDQLDDDRAFSMLNDRTDLENVTAFSMKITEL